MPEGIIARHVAAVQAVLSDDLRAPRYRGHANRLRGHCYVAAEALWHILGGPASGYRPHVLRLPGGETHWFLQATGAEGVLDPTAGQFARAPHYAAGRACGFLTRAPSKRARIVLARWEREIAVRDAAARLGVATLETRNSDALDFHSVAVWSLRNALEEAFDAGRAAARRGAK